MARLAAVCLIKTPDDDTIDDDSYRRLAVVLAGFVRPCGGDSDGDGNGDWQLLVSFPEPQL